MEFVEKLPIKYPSGKARPKRDKRTSLSLIRYADDFVILHKDIFDLMINYLFPLTPNT